MRFHPLQAPLALLLLSTSAFAQDECVNLSLKLFQDGTPVSSPRLVVKQGATGAVQLEGGFRLEATPRSEAATTELQFRLSTPQPDGKLFVASPKIVVQTGTLGAISLSAHGISNYRIEVLPNLVACPA